MKTELTLNVLQTMSAQEYEDIRAAGSDERRELTHAVMRELDAPDNWMMNGEYGSEFGGFFPVQVRFTPAHERFHLALSLIHISEPTRPYRKSRMPSSA